MAQGESLNGIGKTTIKINKKPSLTAGKAKKGRPRKKVLTAQKTKTARPIKAKNKANKKGNVGAFLAVAVLTAILVGGSMYAWYQNKNKKIKIKSALEQRNLEEEMQKQLNVLKNRLNSLKQEKEKLLKEKESLSSQANKLAKAQLTFISNDLGITFFYPALFGDLTATTSSGRSGVFWQAKFSENNNLVLAAVTPDYLTATGSSEFKIIDFFQKDNKYFLHLVGPEEKAVEAKPMKVLSVRGKNILLLDANSLPTDISQQVLRENEVIAIVNLANKKYASLIWRDKDSQQLKIDKLGQILETLRFF